MISVILPVFNGEDYLRASLESVLNQDIPDDYEVLVMNDGSTDGTLDILNAFLPDHPELRIFSRENRGLVESLNELVKLAKGDFIARMDADDLCSPERLRLQWECLREGSADICGSHFSTIKKNGASTCSSLVPLKEEFIFLSLCHSVPFVHGSVMFKKSFWLENNLRYGVDQAFAAIEDYCLWTDFFNAGARFANVDRVLYRYREHSESFSMTKSKLMEEERKALSLQFSGKNILKLKEVLLKARPLNVNEKFIYMNAVLSYVRATGLATFFIFLGKLGPHWWLRWGMGLLKKAYLSKP
jgi:glycosyltransferase involved in cell wall biosynthesis